MKKDWIVRKAWVTMLGAALYALLYALGSQIDAAGAVAPMQTALRFVLALPAAAGVLFVLFEYGLPKLEMRRDAPGTKRFCTPGAFLLIFASFVPMFLIYYPATMCYDIQTQVFQIARNEYSQFHPLLHTLLVRFCLSLYGVFQSFERCAVVYSLISMTFMAGCFALLCASVSRSVNRRAARMATAFFCLYPAHMAFASNMTKDGLFGAVFALFAAYCMESVVCGRLQRKHAALHVLSGMLACMLRNNMIYAMVIWCAFLLLQKKRYLRTAVASALAIALAYGANAGLVAATGADNGSVAEMLSVPIQQLARARLRHDDLFTDEERATMDAYFSSGDTQQQVWRAYEPTLSDPVKNRVNLPLLNEDMGGFFALWASVGKKCPGAYLDAFLNLAHPSLYPYAEYKVVHPYIEVGMQSEGVLTAPFGQQPITQPARFEGLRTWIYENIYRDGMDDHPVLRWVFNTGLIYWGLLAMVLYDMYRGRWGRVTVCALALLLYATYLLGPVMQGRYLYPFVCALPLFVLRPKEGDR